MYNVFNKSDVFFLYDFSTQQNQLIGNRNDLIKFIVKGYKFNCWNENRLENKYFAEVNMGNDIYYFTKETKIKCEDGTYQYIEEKCYNYKRYLFYDGYDRIIDIRLLENECKKYYHVHKNDKKNYNKCNKSYSKNSYTYIFYNCL